MGKIRVLLADDHTILRQGLHALLDKENDIEVVGEATNGRDAVAQAKKLRPDVVLMDANLPEHGGIQVLEMLKEQSPSSKVIILTPPDKIEALLDSALNAGAKGFLPNNISPKELVKGVIKMADEGAAIGPTVIPLIFDKLVERRQEKPVMGIDLSARETEIMGLVAEGMGNHDIAETLFISENTVKGHIRRIIDKLKVNNRVEIARYVLLNGATEHGIPRYNTTGMMK